MPNDEQGPLAGVVVADLSRVLAGPFCTMVLADLGARVIKVEAPGRGDDARHIGPFLNDRSTYFMSVNRGKQSIALDLKQARDRGVFEVLLRHSDVLVENFRPGVMDRLGLGWDDLHARHPELIYASTSGFGQTGPMAGLPAYDIVVQALGGIMSLTGHPGDPPTRVGTSLGDIVAGLFTAIGIQSALHARRDGGGGRRVDVSMLDSQVAILENAISRYVASGEVPGPLGSRHPSITPFEALASRDGFVVVAAGNDELFVKLCATLGCPELPGDAAFASNEARTQNQPQLKAHLEEHLAAETTAHWLERLEAAGVPCGAVNDVASLLDHPQVAARNMLVKAEDPLAGEVLMAGNPIKLTGFQDSPRRDAAPELDADRGEILAWLGIEEAPPVR
ncbi:CoA transferase [Myxococcota bacterium]|nr:CoA transferase [Myxococcota bacterium]